jgi:hypothetical protein
MISDMILWEIADSWVLHTSRLGMVDRSAALKRKWGQKELSYEARCMRFLNGSTLAQGLSQAGWREMTLDAT